MINITNKKAIYAFFIVLFCVSLGFNIYLYATLVKNTQLVEAAQHKTKVMDFRNMFTEKVLLSDREVDFDTRLALETSVRNLNDQEIFDQWQVFTKSTTKEEATAQAKKLLHLLIQKTAY